ncbi:MarR family winged helix-turn-helix transcriptional regulator [Neobacillus niacini]|uniref:MarR family winged helix-turn-helix transcriptional regulator n=1 Tax=Neobacillus niacini TaxID=86668 RepID=UPI00204157C2|nr:MarR family winged helix-turn-helix transcriptional regulator [Neobacillus niacini]MCM3690989.1 MarR family winged helix-turn-helix transcriptional regulator [Neobacillus niacini]
MDVVDFKNILWNYTRKINERTNNLIINLCEHHGITTLQGRILLEIQQHGSHTIGSLATRLHIAGTNISTMCKKLEGKGFIERVRDVADERVVKVALSQKGIRVVEEINKELIEKISNAIEGETDQSLKDIINGLKKLNHLLGKMD